MPERPSMNAIQGFNAEWTAVTRNRDNEKKPNGWRFQAECGMARSFLDKYFKDSYGAAIYAMLHHKCRRPQ